MKLFHGTNDHAWSTIEAEGCLRGPVYLSDDIRVAGYFANWHARKYKANSLILTLDVDVDSFQIDDVSLLDPIPLTIKRLGISDMSHYLDGLSRREGDTWIPWLAAQHGLSFSYNWEVSLRLANTVKINGNIGLDCLLESPLLIRRWESSIDFPFS